jgi:hypothetical protein
MMLCRAAISVTCTDDDDDDVCAYALVFEEGVQKEAPYKRGAVRTRTGTLLAWPVHEEDSNLV